MQHSFHRNCENNFFVFREAYLQHGDYNIIAIDWGMIALNPNYIYASDFVPILSEFNAKFITFLRTQGLDLSTVTIVGHSLGAHIAGLTARTIKKNVDELVNHVVGMSCVLILQYLQHAKINFDFLHTKYKVVVIMRLRRCMYAMYEKLRYLKISICYSFGSCSSKFRTL